MRKVSASAMVGRHTGGGFRPVSTPIAGAVGQSLLRAASLVLCCCFEMLLRTPPSTLQALRP